MKASLVLLLEVASRPSVRSDCGLPRPVVVAVHLRRGDRQPDLARADRGDWPRERAYVLVLEPPLADGGLKTARKGVGRFTLEVEGRAAHAGVEPEKGSARSSSSPTRSCGSRR